MLTGKGGGFTPDTPVGTFVTGEGGYYVGSITYADARVFALFVPGALGRTEGLRWGVSQYTGINDAYDGWANQVAWLAYGLNGYAFNWCDELSFGGKDDWYLPATNELSVVIGAKGSILGSDALPTDIQYYWVSGEASGSTAVIRRFSDNFVASSQKTDTSRGTIPVRRLLIS